MDITRHCLFCSMGFSSMVGCGLRWWNYRENEDVSLQEKESYTIFRVTVGLKPEEIIVIMLCTPLLCVSIPIEARCATLLNMLSVMKRQCNKPPCLSLLRRLRPSSCVLVAGGGLGDPENSRRVKPKPRPP